LQEFSKKKGVGEKGKGCGNSPKGKKRKRGHDYGNNYRRRGLKKEGGESCDDMKGVGEKKKLKL
jgi:hypothetical protein